MAVVIILFQLKKGRDDLDIPAVEEIYRVSGYPLLEYMVFDTDISVEVTKMRADDLLEEILCLHQRTKNMPKYVHTDSDYCHLVAIPASDTHE